MTIPGSGRSEVRIGDAEREAALAALGEHYAQGRLTKDEFDERADAAGSARTLADLRPLFADLPGGPRRVAEPVGAPSRRRGHRGPRVLPVLLVILAVALAVHLWPLLLLAAGVVVFSRARHGRHGGCSRYSNGSPRPSRGSWA